MAIGSFISTIGPATYRVAWSSVNNVAGNYSDVTATITWFSSVTVESPRSQSGHITINGVRKDFLVNPSVIGGSLPKDVSSYTVRVPHDQSGTKSITISSSWDIGSIIGSEIYYTVAASEVVTLDPIRRESSGVLYDFTATNSVTFSVLRTNPSFTHTIRLYVGTTYIKELTNVEQSGTFEFSVSENVSILKAIGLANKTAEALIEIRTFNKDLSVGSVSYARSVVSKPTPSTGTTSNWRLLEDIPSTLLSRSGNGFLHDITLSVGSTTISSHYNVLVGEVVWDLSNSDIKKLLQMMSSSSIESTITVRTKYSSQDIGSSTSKVIITKVSPSTFSIPSFSVDETPQWTVVSNSRLINHKLELKYNGTVIKSITDISSSNTLVMYGSEIEVLLQMYAGKTSDSVSFVLTTYYDGVVVGSSSKDIIVKSIPHATLSNAILDITKPLYIPVSNNSTAELFVYYYEFSVRSFSKSISASRVIDHKMDFNDEEITLLLKELWNAQVDTGTLSVTTYYSGVKVGPTVTSNVSVSVPDNSNPIISDTVEFSDTHAITAAITKGNPIYLSNTSTIKITVPPSIATPVNHSRISKIKVTIEGTTLTKDYLDNSPTEFLLGIPTKVGKHTAEVLVTDSRGLSSKYVTEYEVITYNTPKILSSELSRGQGYQEKTSLYVIGEYTPIIYKNEILSSINRVRWRGRPSVDSSWSGYSDVYSSVQDNTFSVSDSIDLDITEDWQVEVLVTDDYGGSATFLSSITAPVPLLFIDVVKNSIGVGKYPTRNNSLEVGGDLYIGDRKI